jgi:allantoate deiminase
VLERAATVASCTEKPGEILRTFLSPAMEEVHARMRPWFEGIGMSVNVDAAGNLRALYASEIGELSPALIIGSHLDTVPNAGAYDGVLGVLLGLALIEGLGGRRLPYSIEVIGFSDEEGTRFGFPFLGSRLLTEMPSDSSFLESKDSSGVTIRQALAKYRMAHPDVIPSTLSPRTASYLEFHIEQGPVLESRNLSLGVVESVVGQSRCHVIFHGSAGHAGTSPMALRRDALAAAALWITRCESIAAAGDGLVATVGQVLVKPGAVNVIPGTALCSLDVRHADDAARINAVEAMMKEARDIAAERGLVIETDQYHTQPTVQFDSEMISLAERAVREAGGTHIRMTSGAGHDAMVIASHFPTVMIFLRSPGGISHHPDESVFLEDVDLAIQAGLCFLDEFALFLEEGGSNSRE